MEFLVEFEINVPDATPETEVTAREDAESAAAAKLTVTPLEPHPNDPAVQQCVPLIVGRQP